MSQRTQDLLQQIGKANEPLNEWEVNCSSLKTLMKEHNKWELYDMLGNVWEWRSDIYDEEVYGTYRIFRGGGWADEDRSVIATNRRRSHPKLFKMDDLGFRIVKNIH